MNQITSLKKLYDKLKSLETTTSKPKLPITGFDLQKELGLKPGPIFSKIIKSITEAWFENPSINKKEAMDIARKISNGNGSSNQIIEHPYGGNYIPAVWNKLIPTTPTIGSYGEWISGKLLTIAHYLGMK